MRVHGNDEDTIISLELELSGYGNGDDVSWGKPFGVVMPFSLSFSP
jgi:hypothetical protein